MNHKIAMTLAVLIGLYGCQEDSRQSTATQQADHGTTSAETTPVALELTSGIDKSGFDESIRPQDDFYAYVSDGWIESKGCELR